LVYIVPLWAFGVYVKVVSIFKNRIVNAIVIR
jgi:hypothetical protein